MKILGVLIFVFLSGCYSGPGVLIQECQGGCSGKNLAAKVTEGDIRCSNMKIAALKEGQKKGYCHKAALTVGDKAQHPDPVLCRALVSQAQKECEKLRPDTVAVQTANAPLGSDLIDIIIFEDDPEQSFKEAVASPARFTFERTVWEERNNFVIQKTPYNDREAGSILPDSQNITQVAFFSSGSLTNKYMFDFTKDFIIQKTPVQLEVWGEGVEAKHPLSYNRNFVNTTVPANPVSLIRYLSGTVPSSEGVSDTDLTKNINIELVDNEQVTFPYSNASLITANIQKNGLNTITYVFSTATLPGNYVVSANNWVISYSGPQTPSHLVLNGRNFFLTKGTGDYYRTQVTESFFVPSQGEETLIGVNLRFTSGAYWNNTRSHLFQ